MALPDTHSSQQAHVFLLSLIHDSRFVRTVDDIVVEFGNVRYQDVADRFVRGKEVRYAKLRQALARAPRPERSR